MVKNMLKLNDDKTEFIVFGTRQQRSKIDIPHIYINGTDIAPTITVHNLGVMFDSKMSMKAHVKNKNKNNFILHQIFKITNTSCQLFMMKIVQSTGLLILS